MRPSHIAFMVFWLFFLINDAKSISDSEKQEFDKILTPLFKVYDFVKYSVTLIASLLLLFSGISYMASSDDVRKREKIKGNIGYIIVGLGIIWATPLIIELMLK